jgi:hypothetical protein
MTFAARRWLGALAIAAVVIAAVAPTAGAAISRRQRALYGAAYLVSQQRANGAICAFSCVGSTADAVVALVTARTTAGVRDAVDYLETRATRGNVVGIGLEAKVAMAAVARGRNPRSFGGLNLIRAITRTEGGNGHYGDAAVFDQALAMLAVRAAGGSPSSAARSWLAAAQCGDGGWQYDEPSRPGDDAHCFDADAPAPGDFFTSDSNTTSLAIQVLRSGPRVDAALSFLPTLRDGSSGWGYSQCCTSTDINSTSLAIQAYVAAGEPVPDGAVSVLRTSQLRCRAWPFQPGGAADVGATIGAIPGLLGQPFPVPHLRPRYPTVPQIDPC